MVATDRISFFDVILEWCHKKKGTVLTQMSKFWFDLTKTSFLTIWSLLMSKICLNSSNRKNMMETAWCVRNLLCFQIECIVRDISQEAVGQAIRRIKVCHGIKLPEGLKESDKLPEPIYTPSTKAESVIMMRTFLWKKYWSSWERILRGKRTEYAEQLRDKTIALYKKWIDYGIRTRNHHRRWNLNLVLMKTVTSSSEMKCYTRQLSFRPADEYEPGHGHHPSTNSSPATG